VKHPKGVEVDGYGLTIVDLNNTGYKDDPWVLASQVAQVLYVADPAKKTSLGHEKMANRELLTLKYILCVHVF